MFVGVDRFPVLYIGEQGPTKRDSEDPDELMQPYCGLDRDDGDMGQMGVGVVVLNPKTNQASRGWIWGLLGPKNLIASYRGMKILELISRIEHGTLADCWYAGLRKPHSSDQERVDRIVSLIGRQEHARIMEIIPPDLEDAVRLLREKEIHLPNFQFTQEIEAGTLQLTPFLEEIGVELEPAK